VIFLGGGSTALCFCTEGSGNEATAAPLAAFAGDDAWCSGHANVRATKRAGCAWAALSAHVTSRRSYLLLPLALSSARVLDANVLASTQMLVGDMVGQNRTERNHRPLITAVAAPWALCTFLEALLWSYIPIPYIRRTLLRGVV
jgi:hypothetical protein